MEHHRHAGIAELLDTAKGPRQALQRASSRHVSHTKDGAYPARATWTRTGPRSRPSFAARHAAPGKRAMRANGSRSCSKLSAVLRTRGTVERTCVRGASMGTAHRISTRR